MKCGSSSFLPLPAVALLLLLLLLLQSTPHFAHAALHRLDQNTTVVELAKYGHPMFTAGEAAVKNEDDENEQHERMLQVGCRARKIAVRMNEYDVDYKDGDFQFGITNIYNPKNLQRKIGDWWWDWAVQRGSDWEVYYGSMMIEWNDKESIAFGFSSTQDYYPITGGYLHDNTCPHGYVKFSRSEQGGNIRYYQLYVCDGCPPPGSDSEPEDDRN